MKPVFHLFLAALFMTVFIIACSGTDTITQNDLSDDAGNYINGTYEGQTQIDHEGYHASASVKVTQGLISIVDWNIYDNNLNRYFDETYEEVYTGNELYMQQCRDNMIGMNAFGPKLIETQNIDSVDNITGATWCYKKFKEVIGISLQEAYKDTSG